MAYNGLKTHSPYRGSWKISRNTAILFTFCVIRRLVFLVCLWKTSKPLLRASFGSMQNKNLPLMTSTHCLKENYFFTQIDISYFSFSLFFRTSETIFFSFDSNEYTEPSSAHFLFVSRKSVPPLAQELNFWEKNLTCRFFIQVEASIVSFSTFFALQRIASQLILGRT